jgi:hypothetical protein
MTEETPMAEKTRAQLTEENDVLRARIAELEANPTATSRPAPVLPSFGLSEGTRLDILEAQNKLTHDRKVTAMEITEPFTGKVIRVTAERAELLSGDDTDNEDVTPAAPEPTDPQA